MKPCKYILDIHKNIVENHLTDDDFKEEILRPYNVNGQINYQIYGISFGFVKYRSHIIDLTRNHYIMCFKEFTE